MKALREWTEADVQEYVALGRSEGPTLEYKETLYEENDQGRRDQLLYMCGMANGNGGLLFLGIQELRNGNRKTGIPDPGAELGIICPEVKYAGFVRSPHN